ncbi:four helix bundle protein [uncultured Zoogloea sp.]|uniref:four helix bundle protein n=1 Tax=uncultured Zoogloea sp. TaxID=160237 RepID=UPI00260ED4F0|nr:four helix bundle protein [uncultured Zoogloea sp.]
MGDGKWGEWEVGGRPHERLDAWRQGMLLVKAVYDVSARFPGDERFGLTQQMRRAAVSIPSNIAEGAARSGAKEYAHFISVARGSLAELTTQIQIARMLGYLDDTTEILNLTDHVGRLLTGLYRKWSAQ